ncbi:MAG: pilus assembly protein TadG-related protein [Stackebrandtia sp.]
MDAGNATAFTVIITTALVAVAGLVLDAGLALSTKINAAAIAQSAARAGANELDLDHYRTNATTRIDPAAATNAADTWLTQVGAAGSVDADTAQVTVTVTDTHHTQLLSIIGVTRLDVTATATATTRDTDEV